MFTAVNVHVKTMISKFMYRIFVKDVLLGAFPIHKKADVFLLRTIMRSSVKSAFQS